MKTLGRPNRLCRLLIAVPVLLGSLGLSGCQGAKAPASAASQAAAAEAVLQRRTKVQSLLAAGTAARRSKRPEQACRLLREAVGIDPANGLAQHSLGLAYYDLGDLRNAAVHLNAAATLLRDQAEPCYNLGLVLEEGAKYEAAVEAYKRALGRKSNHLLSMENLARVRIKSGTRNEETERLLTTCLDREDRPEWVAWLNQEIARQRNRLSAEAGAGTVCSTRPGVADRERLTAGVAAHPARSETSETNKVQRQ